MAADPKPDEKSSGDPSAFPEGSLIGESSEQASVNLAAASSRLPKIISFRELCRCGDEVWIENAGELYQLRRTRQGKLILTK